MRARSVFVFLLLILASLLPGCDKPASPPAAGSAVRVGVIYPFSGPNASTAADLRAGIELAAEIVNGTFSLPVPLAGQEGFSFAPNSRLELVFRDSESDPQVAAEGAESLVRDDGVAALIGCYSSTVTAAASERAEILQIPFINAASTSPILTRRGFRWFFRTTPDDEIFAENFFAFLQEEVSQNGIPDPRDLTLVYENRLWGTGVAQAEKRLAAKYDFRVVGDIPYDARAEQFDEELENLQALPDGAGIILQASYERDAILLMQGYKARGIHPTAILAMDSGFVSPVFLETLGPDAEFVFSREVWARDLARSNPLVAEVNQMFRERFGRDMTGHSARSFTALVVLADAIERARSTRPEALREALLGTALAPEQLIMPWAGVALDEKTGQNHLGRGIIVQVQGGRYTTVWPTELAASPAIWPMTPWPQRGIHR